MEISKEELEQMKTDYLKDKTIKVYGRKKKEKYQPQEILTLYLPGEVVNLL